MMRRRWLWGLMVLPAFSAGASSGGVPSVPEVKIVYSASTCYGVERGASVSLLSKPQLQQLLAKQPRHPQISEHDLPGPIVLVNMGEQPSAGYSLGLAQAPVQVENAILRLPVIWQKPKPGMMLAQIITHPCLLVSVAAEFQQVEVVDQEGKTTLSTMQSQ